MALNLTEKKNQLNESDTDSEKRKKFHEFGSIRKIISHVGHVARPI
jgi:hypothetical protein